LIDLYNASRRSRYYIVRSMKMQREHVFAPLHASLAVGQRQRWRKKCAPCSTSSWAQNVMCR
jgi:hypothetical protein